MSHRRPFRSVALALLVGSVVTPPQAMAHRVPTPRIFAYVVRQEPNHGLWFTPAELQLMAERYHITAGLDGHGYNWPGAVQDLKAFNPDATVLCHWECMAVQPDAERYGVIDVDETVFIHSAGPAKLTATAVDGDTVLWFFQDARARTMSPFYPPPGVLEYIVESAPAPEGPFTIVTGPIEDVGTFHYQVVVPGVDPDRYFRVRTRLADNSLVGYSWPAAVDPDAPTSIAVTFLSILTGDMVALCYGDCPDDPAQLRIEADFDNSKTFAVNERLPFATIEDYPGGGKLYRANTDHAALLYRYSYRAALATNPAIRAPLAGAYQSIGYNNRIQMPSFGSYFVWSMHPTYLGQSTQRLTDALELGYDGMRLDFALDTLQLSWASSGVLPDWAGPGDPRIRDQVDAFLSALSAHEPGVIISINGRNAVLDTANYYDYLSDITSGETEFFAIGNNPFATDVDGSTSQQIQDVWTTRALGKTVALISGAHSTNHLGRLKCLALYLLIQDEEVSFYNATEGVLEDVIWLPEWEVPLGDAVVHVNDWSDIIPDETPTMLFREFTHGAVYYNADAQPVIVPLPKTMCRLSVTGGLSTRVGGDGEAHYDTVNGLILQPGEPAILVAIPGDLNCDLSVGFDDLLALLAAWGPCSGPCPADLDGDDDVGFSDLLLLLANWG